MKALSVWGGHRGGTRAGLDALSSTRFGQEALLAHPEISARFFAYSWTGHSFSIWSTSCELVYDSGDIMEYVSAIASPENFNSTNDENDTFDDRSDDKGPEPESAIVGLP